MHTTFQRGFIMVWAAGATAVVLMLAAAAFFALSAAMRREIAMEISIDETLIAQEVLEKAKYNARFGEALPLPTETVRNGRSYEIHVSQTAKSPSGIPMTEITCRVTHEGGDTFEMATLVERDQ